MDLYKLKLKDYISNFIDNFKYFRITLFYRFIFRNKKFKDLKCSSDIELVIGDCGSGKSCYAVHQALKWMRKGHTVYSNIYMKGVKKLVIEDLMKYNLDDKCIIIFDEAASYGLAARGTSYKDSSKSNVIEFFTMYRHYKIHKMYVISPSFADVIPIVRSRINRIVVCKKSIFNFLGIGYYRSIGKSIMLAENGGTSEPKETYFWRILSRRWFNRRDSYKVFDTYSRKDLEEKDWEIF